MQNLFSKALSSNFIKRTLSGFIFVALIVSSILLSSYAFAIFFAIICGMAVIEFHKLTNKQADVEVNTILAFIGALLLFFAAFVSASGLLSFPVYSVYLLYAFPVVVWELFRKKNNPIHNIAYFVLGQVTIAVPFALLNYILYVDGYQPLLLLSVFITIWVNDTGAYLVGVSIGKHRLFERVSPKKSWEGFWGGVVAAAISGIVFSKFIPTMTVYQWILISEIIVFAGTFGDLLESLMKRTVQVKDSGVLIPGHGGLLDRFDSMLLAAPVVFIIINILKQLNILF